jgi:hypothetical protein
MDHEKKNLWVLLQTPNPKLKNRKAVFLKTALRATDYLSDNLDTG